MSWLFSQALVEAFSAATCSAGVPSAPLSVMPTPHKFWRNDKTMEPSQLSRFGLTCAVLTESLGEALLTWFRADSRVRTYPLPGMEPELTASAPASGGKWHESSAKYDLDSSSWRTHRSLFDEALPWSSVTLPSWGMTRAGVLWEPPTSGRPISATASGLWPTPTVHGNYNRPGASKNAGWGLASAVKAWPTPTASMHKGWSPGHNRASTDDRLDYSIEREAHELNIAGRLNPAWVEWLMGWPTGWTDLKPLEMARFHEWQRQHSLFWQRTGSEEAA